MIKEMNTEMIDLLKKIADKIATINVADSIEIKLSYGTSGIIKFYVIDENIECSELITIYDTHSQKEKTKRVDTITNILNKLHNEIH